MKAATRGPAWTLPVAAAAQTHFVVTKEIVEGRTISRVELLNKTARVAELTRMLGGDTPAARRYDASLEYAAEKEEFGAVRRARWFGRS